jgi:hypothetical protein
MILAVAVAGLIACPFQACAQKSSTAAALRAAFVYNFTKFTEWPADALPPGQRLVLCIAEADDVADALEQIIKAHGADRVELTVEILAPGARVRACHLLYIGTAAPKRIVELEAAVQGAAVLTVSNADRFAETGGIAQLIEDKERMRFAINIAAATRARLKLSSKLLSLAQIIKDNPNAPPP